MTGIIYFTSISSITSIPMISETLSMWGNGAVTLPKKWRTRFATHHFMAIEVSDGLLIKPIEEIEYYELKDGTVGLRFPYGIDMRRVADMFDAANKRIDAKEKKKKPSRKRRNG